MQRVWYVKRSALNAVTDEDRAMTSESYGPFYSSSGAHNELVRHVLREMHAMGDRGMLMSDNVLWNIVTFEQ